MAGNETTSASTNTEESITSDKSGKLDPRLQLMIEFMNEHYAAARHHQALRTHTLAFLVSAAAVLFAEGIKAEQAIERGFFGWSLIALAVFALIANLAFYRSNRMHAETATACRKLVAKGLSSGDTTTPADPIWVRKAVERAMKFPFYNVNFEEIGKAREAGASGSRLKIESLLSAVFHLVPIIMMVAGIAVLADSS